MFRAISIALLILSMTAFYLSYAGAQKTSDEEPEIQEMPETENTEGIQAQDRVPGEVVVIEINGTINPGTLDYIRSGIDEAREVSAEAFVILLDTPGGLLSSTKEIVKLLLNSPVPVIVYVSPSGATATSAGVFITLAANVAAMAPGTSIGAAHPVSLSPGGTQPEKKEDKKTKDAKDGKKVSENEKENKEDEEADGKSQDDVMGEKIVNFASSFVESIAEQRGRNVEWAIDAVRESDAITATEALEINVIDVISPNLTQLLIDIDGKEVKLPQGERKLLTKGATIIRIAMSAKQKLIDILSTPDIAFMLLSLGSLGILLEFYNPGLIFPGVAGVVCLLMGFVSFQILPFNYAGVVLLLLAIGLFVTEVYVTSFGLLSLGGVISFALGALLLFDTPESDVRVGFEMVIATTLAIGLFFFYVAYYLIKAQKLSPQMGYEGLLGQQGEAVSDIHGTGKVYLLGEYWNAESEEPIGKGEKIEVLEYKKGFKLKVKKTDS
jgi:membrane-bound serine protease (ClpP class)